MAAPSSAPQGAPLSNPVLPYPYPPGAERPLRDIENRLRGQRVLLAGIVDIFAGWPTGSHPAREGVVQSYNQEKWQYVHQEASTMTLASLAGPEQAHLACLMYPRAHREHIATCIHMCVWLFRFKIDLFGQAIARGDASAALLQMSAEADAALRYVPHYLNVQQEQTYPVGLLDHVWMDCCLAPIEIYTEEQRGQIFDGVKAYITHCIEDYRQRASGQIPTAQNYAAGMMASQGGFLAMVSLIELANQTSIFPDLLKTQKYVDIRFATTAIMAYLTELLTLQTLIWDGRPWCLYTLSMRDKPHMSAQDVMDRCMAMLRSAVTRFEAFADEVLQEAHGRKGHEAWVEQYVRGLREMVAGYHRWLLDSPTYCNAGRIAGNSIVYDF